MDLRCSTAFNHLPERAKEKRRRASLRSSPPTPTPNNNSNRLIKGPPSNGSQATTCSPILIPAPETPRRSQEPVILKIR
ncbi:hypothetical protein CDAR_233771 [Caerostris darwini]|uniref:Uncharacterized protein n=1 Tax=Caerostris darwini TaxID=1538125 RepID=A0AAV4PYG2_9ARAC|nr:hypothetical protein CDAR_233771 [Caerostris darwini]